jgi:hypothetical protein
MRLHNPAEEKIQAFFCAKPISFLRSVSEAVRRDAGIAQAPLDPKLNCDYKKEQTFTSGSQTKIILLNSIRGRHK